MADLSAIHLVFTLLAFATPVNSSSLSMLQDLPGIKSQFDRTANLAQSSPSYLHADVSVPSIAQQITVRILADQDTGSGVIINRQGQAYTVLTCAHVVDGSKKNQYTVLTGDGLTHSGRWLRSVQFKDKDLALVQFSSSRTHQVAVIGGSNGLSTGDTVYASGFPSWRWINPKAIATTRSWGLKAFRLTKGKVAMLPNKPLQQGYQLGYTNEIEPGMSGGPVLDQYGRLIGLNGGLKYPPQGIIAFIFADGSLPSEELFRQMEALSWAIPITASKQMNKSY